MHACVAANFLSEFGGYLRVPLARAALVEPAAAPTLASPVSPRLGWTILYVANVARSRAFYVAALGLRPGTSAPPGSDAPVFAEFETGSTRLALCSRELAASNFSSPAFFSPASLDAPAQASEVAIVVADVPSAFARAVEAGAVAAEPPKTKPWGQLVSYIRDLDGHVVEICSEM